MTTTKSLRAGVSSAQSFADDSLRSGEHALDHTLQAASHAIDRAGEKVRDLRYGVRDLASKGASGVAETAAAAQERLSRYADVTRRYVSDEPVKSALIAAAVGAVVAGLIIAARRRNH